MGPLSLTTAVDASRERAFDFICDLSLRPAWTDHFAEDFRLARLNPAGEGAAARFGIEAPGGIREIEIEIAEADRPSRIVERGRGGRWNRIPIHTVWELTEGPGAISTVTLTFWTEPPDPFGRLREVLHPLWWRRRWSLALRRLREAIESDQTRLERVGVAAGAHLPA